MAKVIRIVAFSRDEETGGETVYDIREIPADTVFTNRNSLSAKVTGPLRDLLDNEPWVSRISIERGERF